MRAFVVIWWALLIRGLAGILLGIAAFVYTGVTLAVLVLLFAAYLVADGIFRVVAGFRPGSWCSGIQDVLTIAAGLIAWRWPGITALILVVLTVIWALLTGGI